MFAELQHAFRLLWKAPAFTVAAVFTLALGIGGNVAVFTFVDAVLFRPLPFDEPDRLVTISESHAEKGQHRVGVLPGSLLDWRERSRSFEHIAMMRSWCRRSSPTVRRSGCPPSASAGITST